MTQLCRHTASLLINCTIAASCITKSMEDSALGMLVPVCLAVAADVPLVCLDHLEHADNLGGLSHGGASLTHLQQLHSNRDLRMHTIEEPLHTRCHPLLLHLLVCLLKIDHQNKREINVKL